MGDDLAVWISDYRNNALLVGGDNHNTSILDAVGHPRGRGLRVVPFLKADAVESGGDRGNREVMLQPVSPEIVAVMPEVASGRQAQPVPKEALHRGLSEAHAL